MKAILKKDFYENFKSTILSIIYILALSISLNLVNSATSKVFLRRFIFILGYGLVIISLNYCLRDVNNSNYMDYFKYPIKRSDFVNAKYIEFIGIGLIYMGLILLSFIMIKIPAYLTITLFSLLFILSLISFLLPLAFAFANKGKIYPILFLLIIVLCFGLLGFGTIKTFKIYNFININDIKIIIVLISFIFLTISYVASKFIINRKEF